MSAQTLLALLLALSLVCACLSSAVAQDSKASPAVGTGMSAADDPEAAGAEAAKKALAELKGATPRLVMLFDNVNDKQKLLKGVSSIFPADLIYGCSAYAPITAEGNEGKVGVLALAGIDVTAAMASAAAGHEACGKEIGTQLKDVQVPAGKGKLMILFGNCHIYTNRELVKGAQAVLGETFPIVGGAAEGDKPVYFKGKVQKNTNVGLLLSGNFATRTSLQGNKGEGADVAIATAGVAAKEVVGADKDKTLMVFAFDCGGRRGWLGKQVPKELDAMKATTGDLPLFGWYGSGEIGINPNGKSSGEGFHLSMCAILKAE